MVMQAQEIQAQRWRDYLAYEQYERERNEPAPYRSCEELIDYTAIQERAIRLLEAHEAKPKVEIKQEYQDNARTALFEALTASGHLSRIELGGTLDEINTQVLNRLLNGYDYDLPDHELKRRFQEICEELVIQEVQLQIANGMLPPDTEVATESTYVVGMSDDAAKKIGYRPYNRKGMTRSTGLRMHEDGTVTRVIEQVSYSNSSAEDSISRLSHEGIIVNREHAADIDLLGHQLVYSRHDLAEGVIGLQRRIDAYQGADVRFGEVPDEATPTYETIRAVSKEREELVEQFIDRLAKWEEVLDESLRKGEIDRAQWTKLYGREVRDIVRAICVLQPAYTESALGEAVVKEYYAANELLMSGDASGAADMIDSVASQEQSIVFCGGEVSAIEVGQGVNGQTQELLELGTKKWCKCPFCQADVFMDPCADNVDCWSCEASVRGGKVVSTGKGRQRESAMKNAERQDQELPGRKKRSFVSLEDYDIKEQIIIGGTRKTAVHKETGMELTEEQTKELLVLAA